MTGKHNPPTPIDKNNNNHKIFLLFVPLRAYRKRWRTRQTLLLLISIRRWWTGGGGEGWTPMMKLNAMDDFSWHLLFGFFLLIPPHSTWPTNYENTVCVSINHLLFSDNNITLWTVRHRIKGGEWIVILTRSWGRFLLPPLERFFFFIFPPVNRII